MKPCGLYPNRKQRKGNLRIKPNKNNFIIQHMKHFLYYVNVTQNLIVSHCSTTRNTLGDWDSLIASKGDPTWVQTVKNSARCPGLDSKDWQKLLLDQDGPRLMSTHLPIQLFPMSYFTSKAKVSGCWSLWWNLRRTLFHLINWHTQGHVQIHGLCVIFLILTCMETQLNPVLH